MGKCFPASAFQDPSAKPSHHSNHLQPKGRAFLENRSGGYPLHLTLSQFVLKIHQIIIAYSKFAVQSYCTAHTTLHSRQAESSGCSTTCTSGRLCPGCGQPHSSEHSRPPTQWRPYRMSSHSSSAALSNQTRAPSLTSMYHHSSSTRNPQKMQRGHPTATMSSYLPSVQTMPPLELCRPWRSKTSASAPSPFTPATT